MPNHQKKTQAEMDILQYNVSSLLNTIFPCFRRESLRSTLVIVSKMLVPAPD